MNIFVGKLPYAVTSEYLQEIFEEFGEVGSAKVIIDRDSGRSKGFGFVEMDNEDEGNAAIEGLNGAEIDGRTIVVNKARPREENRGGGGGGGGYRGGGGGGGGYRGGGGGGGYRGGGGRY